MLRMPLMSSLVRFTFVTPTIWPFCCRGRSQEWHIRVSGHLLASDLLAIRDSFRSNHRGTSWILHFWDDGPDHSPQLNSFKSELGREGDLWSFLALHFVFLATLQIAGAPSCSPLPPLRLQLQFTRQRNPNCGSFWTGGGFDGRVKSRILIWLLKEMLMVDQEPTLLLLPPIWQQTQWNRKVKYSGNSTREAEERRPPWGQTEKKTIMEQEDPL